MKKTIVIAIAGLGLAAWSAAAACEERFVVTDEFVEYIQSAANPHQFGLQDDRFYPYSTPLGRRIAYRQPVTDKSWYAQGWATEEASRQLRKDLQQTAEQLRRYLGEHYCDHPFDRLPPKCQEMLLDLAHSEGAASIKPETYRAIITEDWKALIDGCLYVRMQGCRPDISRNKAFAERWIYFRK
jgi:hypothetical protein